MEERCGMNTCIAFLYLRILFTHVHFSELNVRRSWYTDFIQSFFTCGGAVAMIPSCDP